MKKDNFQSLGKKFCKTVNNLYKEKLQLFTVKCETNMLNLYVSGNTKKLLNRGKRKLMNLN